MSSTTFDRDAMAQWYANRHLETDDAVQEIHYLPAGAPDREIRFLEVNKLVSENTPMEAVDFGVDIGGAEAHRLYVLDVTPHQWDQIRQNKLRLPQGWTLNHSIAYRKK